MTMLFLRRFVFALFGLALGLVLCVQVFRHAQVGAADWRALAASLSPLWCVVVVLMTHALMIAGARKWAILSRALHGAEAGQEPASGFFLRHYLWQNWIGQFVPPSLAIILGRAWAARHMPDRKEIIGDQSAAASVKNDGMTSGESGRIDRRRKMISGLWSGILDQALEFALLISFLGGSALVLFYGGGATAFVLGAGAGTGVLALIALIGRRWMPQSLRVVLWPLFGWSAVRAGLTVLRLFVGVAALGLYVSEIKIAALAPVVSLLALIPLTPGNLGIAEWGWQAGLVWAEQGAVAAALFAAGFRILVLLAQTLLLAAHEGALFLRERKVRTTRGLPVQAFLMLRHGETVANAQGTAAGSLDTPLTDKGRAQARAAAAIITQLQDKPSLVIHSNLSRARDTAAIINETLGLSMIEIPALAERNYGDWVGQSWTQVYARLLRGETPPSGESRPVFIARAMTGLDEALSRGGALPLIVAHGGVFDALFETFGCKEIDVQNCVLYGFTPRDETGADSGASCALPWQVWLYGFSAEGELVREEVRP